MFNFLITNNFSKFDKINCIFILKTMNILFLEYTIHCKFMKVRFHLVFDNVMPNWPVLLTFGL